MAQNDRTQGLIGHTGIKAPVRAATTANITLSGLQTIDGIALAADDRVLVKNQTAGAENGIYLADTGDWERAADWDGSNDIVSGTLVFVTNGTTNATSFWYVSTANPITIATTSVAFAVAVDLSGTPLPIASGGTGASTVATARTNLGLNAQFIWGGTAGGTADALTLTPTPALETYEAGQTILFKSGAAANTAATTLAVSAQAAKAVQGKGVALVGGEIEADTWYLALYDGAAFQLARFAPAVLLELFTTKGDLVAATADGKVARLALGAAGTIPVARAAATTGLAYAAALRGAIDGVILSNNAGDATNDIDIAVGGAMDDTNAYWMTLGGALTKQLDAAWGVGTNAGMRDAGAISDATWHIYLIVRSDTGVVDILASLSASAPTMPTSYDFKRRIGSIIRSAGAIVAFSQMGEEFLRSVPVSDFVVNNPGATAVLRALSVPVGIKVIAILAVAVSDSDRSTGPPRLLVTSPDQADTAPSATVFTAKVIDNAGAAEQGEGGAIALVRTNTSAQVRTRVDGGASAEIDIWGCTFGWIDARGRDA